MRSKEGYFPGYNIQSTVDSKNMMLAQFDVTDKQNDFFLLFYFLSANYFNKSFKSQL
jgi:hypothetical protein